MRLFSDLSESIEDPYLRRAYRLAVRGIGRTSPNPAVGCVVVADGTIVGEGWHERAGEPHAEVIALREAGRRAADSTVYVTLEPCAHQGRTPPCTDALIEAGVAQVVIGMRDPNHIAAGGAEILRSFGIRVTFVEDPGVFETLNEPWLKRMSTGLPWVTVKVALSLDGKVARTDGVRTAISGPGSRSVTMGLRERASAVLVGARTVSIDDPSLTVRDDTGETAERQPVRVVLCRDTVPVDASILHDGLGPVVLLVPTGLEIIRPLPSGVEPLRYDGAAGLHGAFEALAGAGLSGIVAEPGPHLFSALWEAGLIDELVLIHAGGVAGNLAPGVFHGEGEGSPTALHRRFSAVEAGVVGDDAVTRWRPRT